MAALNLNPKAPPVFLRGNLLTRHADRAGDLTLSSGVDLRHRLYDMDPTGQWQGENDDDAIDETATFGLWRPGMQSAEDVDFLAVLNHNLLAFDWDFSADNGGSYPGANQQVVAAETEANTIHSLAAVVPADKLRLTMHSTQTADQFKQVGAIVVAEALLQAPIGMSLFKPHPLRMRDREAVMADGSKRSAPVYRSDAKRYFRDFSVGFTGLSESEADALEAVLVRPEDFIFYPRPGDQPGLMYLGKADTGTVARFPSNLAAGTETITFDFEETGGA